MILSITWWHNLYGRKQKILDLEENYGNRDYEYRIRREVVAGGR